jgi:hypothetical protein
MGPVAAADSTSEIRIIPYLVKLLELEQVATIMFSPGETFYLKLMKTFYW